MQCTDDLQLQKRDAHLQCLVVPCDLSSQAFDFLLFSHVPNRVDYLLHIHPLVHEMLAVWFDGFLAFE